jgi:hypothetical protein
LVLRSRVGKLPLRASDSGSLEAQDPDSEEFPTRGSGTSSRGTEGNQFQHAAAGSQTRCAVSVSLGECHSPYIGSITAGLQRPTSTTLHCHCALLRTVTPKTTPNRHTEDHTQPSHRHTEDHTQLLSHMHRRPHLTSKRHQPRPCLGCTVRPKPRLGGHRFVTPHTKSGRRWRRQGSRPALRRDKQIIITCKQKIKAFFLSHPNTTPHGMPFRTPHPTHNFVGNHTPRGAAL